MSGSPTVRQWSTCLSALLHVSRVCERVADTVCVCVCVALQRLRQAMRHGMSVRSSSTAVCGKFTSATIKSQFRSAPPPPSFPPCSTATTAGSALGFLINAAGGDIHRTWQQAARSKQHAPRSTARGAALAFLLYFRFATKISRHFANVGCRN